MTRFSEGVVLEGVSQIGDLRQLERQEVVYKKRLAVRIIEEMTKDEFHRKFVGGRAVTRNPIFGKLVNFGAEELKPDEVIAIRSELNKVGFPPDLTYDSAVIDAIAQAVAKRSVKVY